MLYKKGAKILLVSSSSPLKSVRQIIMRSLFSLQTPKWPKWSY